MGCAGSTPQAPLFPYTADELRRYLDHLAALANMPYLALSLKTAPRHTGIGVVGCDAATVGPQLLAQIQGLLPEAADVEPESQHALLPSDQYDYRISLGSDVDKVTVLQASMKAGIRLLDLLESNGYDFVSSTVDNYHNYQRQTSVYYFKRSTQKTSDRL